MVAAREPDLIVLDRSMPGMDGIAVCREIKSNPFLSRVPILILTALATVDFKIEGFDAGRRRLFGQAVRAARIDGARRVAACVWWRAKATAIRRRVCPVAAPSPDEIESRVARGETCAVVYIDIDHFKPFADTFGFVAADEVIIETGKLMGEIVAPNGDFAGHIGGDDFLLVCAPDRARALSQTAADGFGALVARAVGSEAAARGTFPGTDRKGVLNQFPLARLTSVIVPVEPQSWVSVAHLGEAAATWKLAAKSNGGGQIVEAR